jgi:Saccharopine dehydrogenase NADP binding domain
MAPAPSFAVYGANGHTGRLVTAELLARGQDVVLAGRNAEALKAMADGLGSPDQVRTHVAPLDDPASLRALAAEASVLIHCAGPFSVTGEPVASAAAEAGCHYVDHALEPHHVKRMFDAFPAPAERAGIVMIPGISFYAGLGDLLAAAVTDGMPQVDRVTTAYAVTGWRMTTGAKNTATQLFADTERITFTDGAFHLGYVEPRNVVFPFPPPLGPRTMIAPVPFGEVVTIPRHVPVRNVEAQLTAHTFTEEQVFVSEDADAAARARTDFTVAVQAMADPSGRGGRAGQVSGHDLWRAGALASVEAARRRSQPSPSCAPSKGSARSRSASAHPQALPTR